MKADEVIVCEGYTDVIGFDQVGLPRAVATCGTALTEDHLRSLRSFARRLVLAFDADAAGQAAAERVYEWERRSTSTSRSPSCRAAPTPADLARSDPDALRTAVADAVPFLGFRVGPRARRRPALDAGGTRPRRRGRAGGHPSSTRASSSATST